MKQFFTFLSAIFIGSTAMGQVAFQSDLSTWANGLPTDWDGTATNLAASSTTEVTIGATYGSSMANLVNTSPTSHKRFSSQPFTVTPATTYEITVYVAGLVGEMRTGHYDITNSAYNPTSAGQYNGYVDISTISGGATLGMFTQSVTTDVSTTSIEVILSFRGSDVNGVLVDSVSVSIPANPPTPVNHTISEIQDNGGNNSALEDSLVITSGVVTALRSGEGYWIQDGVGAWSGIYVEDDSHTPSRGDSITVTGKVDEIFGITQIGLVTNYVLEATPSVAITASVVSSSDLNNLEDWEGVLVKVQTGACTNADAGFGQWTINSGVAVGDTVLVDDDLYGFTPTLAVNYDVTGIGHYSYSATKLLPRDAADIITSPTGINEHNLEFSIYPNPATHQIMIKGIETANILIYDISGHLIYNTNMIANQTINVSDFSAGIYLVKLVSNGTSNTQKLVIK